MIEFPAEYHPALAAHDRHAEMLLALPRVVGVAVGRKVTGGETTGEFAVRVFVERKAPAGPVPPVLDGVRTDVVEIGRPGGGPAPVLPAGPSALRTRQRPARGGCSISSPIAQAGTLGAVCHAGGEVFVLSANHVIAASNRVHQHSPVLQPGLGEATSAGDSDTLGTLHERVHLRLGPDSHALPNRLDAAIAEVDPAHVDWPIAEIGLVRGLNLSPRIGMAVHKTGRTTGHTAGVVTDVHALIRVSVRNHTDTLFQEQCIVELDVGAGDSGSLVVDENGGAVGLLSHALVRFAVVNPIGFVVDTLGITLTKP